MRVGLNTWNYPAPNDSDGDQMNDVWEMTYFGSLVETADADRDIDGSIIYWDAVPGWTFAVYWTSDLSQPFTRISSGLTSD